MKVTGAQSLIRSLEACDVEVMFGLPGGAILPAYDPIRESSVRHILVRHEQGAGHAAEGYAWATGKVGVCMATSGPGATNLVTALCDAYMDSVPLVAITGQVPSWAIGSDAFQEADTTGITMPVTKHNELVLDVDRIPGAVAEAFHIAASGRPGPVLVDVPKDILQATTEWAWPSTTDLPGYRPVTRPNGKRVREAAALLRAARRPVLYVGGGVTKAGAEAALRELAEASGAPVTTTLMARGAFPDSHPLALGMPGMHGNYAAVAALQEADLLVALGARFDDRVTGNLATFAPKARIIHADIDPAEIGKNRVADVPIVGDVKLVIEELAAAYKAAVAAEGAADTEAWQGAWPSGSSASRSATTSRTAARSSPSTWSSGCRPSPAARRWWSPGSASTRCTPPSTSASTGPGPGSTPAGWARWASPCRRPWGPRSAGPTSWWWRSTATAASR